MPRSGKLYALDVTVVDGSADACVEHAEAFTSVTRAVEEREKVKREHYSVCPASHEFIPFAVGYQIELGAGARSFINLLASAMAYKQSGMSRKL